MRSIIGLRWKDPCKEMCWAQRGLLEGPRTSKQKAAPDSSASAELCRKAHRKTTHGQGPAPAPASLNMRKTSAPALLCCLPDVLMYVSTSIASQMHEKQKTVHCTQYYWEQISTVMQAEGWFLFRFG